MSLNFTSFALDSQTNFDGIWYSEEMDNMSIKIYQSDDGYWYGKIIASDIKDDVGKLMLRKLSYNEVAKSLNGEIQKPDSKFTASATLILKSPNRLQITAKKFLMSRNFDLERL